MKAKSANFDSLPKRYEPATAEAAYAEWEQKGYFDSAPKAGRPGNYCIMLPPPNVTGTLHMGHAFQHTLMDALIRHRRMLGDNTLWQAGTDHAGIATQIVVTRELERQGINAAELPRDEFLRHAWSWKERSGGVIASQMRRLGASCDWQRERFTMDEGLSAAVTDAFVRLHEAGLIYRGKRLVNWDPVLQTAVSDLEVASEEEAGVMYYVRYPFVDDAAGGVVIGTTRPETILVDGAIAIHPQDKRAAALVGRRVFVPLTEPPRPIEIIADEHVDPEFGSGCVKITAAHDFNDYAVYERHPNKNIPLIVLFTPEAKMNENAPPKYRGMDRFDARRQIVQDLADCGLLLDKKPHVYKLPRGDRSGAVVEPMLTDQWFLRMDDLARRGMALAEADKLRFVPANWRRVYDQWLGNIHDWCLSRQLLWGHQIPAWHDEDGNVVVARNEQEAAAKAPGKKLTRDPDVLDTWFSSALWPFSTLGWPSANAANNAHFAAYFPTSVLVTGFDILFFWVARMAMFADYFVGDTPFRDVYITGLVRDGEGKKMSKSRGNVLDPLDLVDGIDADSLANKRAQGLMNPAQAKSIVAKTRREFPDGIPAYGADALRFTFASLASHGRDIKFDLSRCEGYRHFCNKLWNASRFVMGVCAAEQESNGGKSAEEMFCADAWILSRLNQTAAAVEREFAAYRFDLAADAVYRFFWRDYCDWYVEAAKAQLQNGDAQVCAATKKTLAGVLEAGLRLCHPLIPFVTEQLWQKVAPLAGAKTEKTVMLAAYPRADKNKICPRAEDEMKRLVAATEAARKLRAEAQAAGAAPRLRLRGKDAPRFAPLLAKLAGVAASVCPKDDDDEENADAVVAGGITLVPEGGGERAKERLALQLQKTESQLAAAQAALANPQFARRAPPPVVEKKRAVVAALDSECQDLRRRLRQT